MAKPARSVISSRVAVALPCRVSASSCPAAARVACRCFTSSSEMTIPSVLSASRSPVSADVTARITCSAPPCALLNEVISPATLMAASDRSAASCCVAPMPSATAPNVAASPRASVCVSPAMLASLRSSSSSFCAAGPKTVANLLAVSSAADPS